MFMFTVQSDLVKLLHTCDPPPSLQQHTVGHTLTQHYYTVLDDNMLLLSWQQVCSCEVSSDGFLFRGVITVSVRAHVQ